MTMSLGAASRGGPNCICTSLRSEVFTILVCNLGVFIGFPHGGFFWSLKFILGTKSNFQK